MEEPRFPKCYKTASKPHKFCPGCGHPIVLKMLAQSIEELDLIDKTVFLVDIGCSLLAWDFFDLPTSQTHHGRTTPVSIGFKMADPQKIVIAYMGDGGAYAIGLQHTITACLRDDPVTTIVVNNTLYGMTGGQMAPTTVDNQSTSTTPAGKKDSDFKTIQGPEMLFSLGNKNAFLARGSVIQPLVLKGYIKKAIETQINHHYSFVEAISVCPLNWKTNAAETLQRAKDLEKNFKLGEIK